MLSLVFRKRWLAALALAATLASPVSQAAPYTPANDAEVVERLPLSASDPSIRRVDSLRKQLAARPDDAALRIEIARRYFDLAGAQGDPRYVGYAAAAITPLADRAADNASYWLLLGMVQQYSHEFDKALVSLHRANDINPRDADAMAWRAAIYMVQARYDKARAECTQMAPLVDPLLAAGCSAYVRAATGELAPAYADLRRALDAAGNAPPELKLWAATRLAEMAQRLQQPAAAEAHFKRALQLGITDQFLLAAYADFLLQQQRPAEVMVLLADWERSDVLLLRLALAGQATKDSRATAWAKQMRERFAAASERSGQRLHEQEAARFALEVDRNARAALEIAADNYKTQKEPRDAEVLMRSALAANTPAAAQPALAWLRESRYEDARLAQLASQLAAAPAAAASAGGKP
ncbi:MAG: hypothetical protein V4562_00590 [Pseudomonadota bacterium]